MIRFTQHRHLKTSNHEILHAFRLCMTLLTARAAGVQNLNLSLVVDRKRYKEVGEFLVDEIRLARLDEIDESGFFRSDLSIPLVSKPR
mmetsp:Transcript_23051/g.33132  ORF Transcript_23051/g.33132 Transcript_23051/m.33132 type:complete len:88 (-) Transcript_23051:539-802(-)